MRVLEECCAEAIEVVGSAFDGHLNGADWKSNAREVAFVLSHDVISELFLGVARARASLDDVESFARGLLSRARGPGRAAALYLLSRCAELRDDVHGAEALLGDALAADATYAPAMRDAGWYASDRGDAVRARDLLRRSYLLEGIDPGPGAMDEFCARGPATARRNEPCPCGSGRKYKVCCAARRGWDLPSRCGWLLRKARTFATREIPFETVLDVAKACDRASEDDLRELANDAEVIDAALFEGGLLERFCDVRGALLPADELELAREWSRVRARVYAVVVAIDGQIELRDEASGEVVRVVDPDVARAFPSGSLLYARVTSNGSRSSFIGRVCRIADEARDDAVRLVSSDASAGERMRWLSALEYPEIRTPDGHEIQFFRAIFEVDDAREARSLLTEVLDDEGEDGLAFRMPSEAGPVTRGWVRFGPDGMEVDAISRMNFDELLEIVESALPDAELVWETSSSPLVSQRFITQHARELSS